MSSEEESSMELMQDLSLKGCKVKRTRQRVDAGEPRNSYASIANFSSRGGYNSHNYHHPFNGLNLSPPNKFGDIINKTCDIKSEMIVLDDPMMQLCVNGTLGAGQIAPYVNGGGKGFNSNTASTGGANTTSHHHSPEINFNNCNNKNSATVINIKSPVSSDSTSTTGAHLLRDILQTGRKFEHSIVDTDQPYASGSAKVGLSQCSDASDLDDVDEEEDMNKSSRDDEGMDQNACAAGDEISHGNDKQSRSPSPASEGPLSNRPNNTNSNNSDCSTTIEVKRARVENIVTNMLLGSNGGPNASTSGKASSIDAAPSTVNGCKKRKLYQPQQSKLNSPAENEEDFEEVEEMPDDEETVDDDEDDIVSELDLSKKNKTEDRDNLRRQLEDMQSQLFAMRQRYMKLFEAQQQNANATHLVNAIGSPVNLITSESPADECDTEMDDTASDKGDITPISQLSGMTNRDTPAISTVANVSTNTVASNIINDPSHFIDEARRLITEQEKMTKSSDRQSCIIRPITTPSSGSMPLFPGHLPFATASISELQLLIEAIKRDIQTSVNQIVDTTFTKFLQRRNASQKLSFDQSEPSKDLTLLSQMLDRKSPRTKVIDRGAAAAIITSPVKGNTNGHSARGSPFSLPTEAAPAPKHTPFPFPPPNFKSPFFIPSVAPPGAQMPHQPVLIPSATALAQHFTSIASTLNHHRGESLSNNYITRDRESTHSNRNTNGHHPSSGHAFHRSDEPLPEQTEAMSLVVAPKRKRHKVTDTRITPRTVSRLLGQEPLISCGHRESSVSPPGSINYHGPPPPPPLVPVSLPTSVAIPNPSLHQSDMFGGSPFPFGDHPRLSIFGDMNEDDHHHRDGKGSNAHAIAASAVAHAAAAHHLHMLAASRASPDSLHGFPGSAMHYGRVGSDNGADNGSETNETQMYDSTMPLTSTLTPMHLRKAKLMFFFVRYPSSAILKMYFPDIKFNKNNTAQLVKWFSNFREFYYIQMEKYARQALSEGVKNAEELTVSADAELLRVLNLHYNRNNHIDVPENFRYVTEQTLREFFKAVILGKDTEQSWKKAIYKIIARLDDNVPEYFKSPNFLEQLE